jgi:hypothetical protein
MSLGGESAHNKNAIAVGQRKLIHGLRLTLLVENCFFIVFESRGKKRRYGAITCERKWLFSIILAV